MKTLILQSHRDPLPYGFLQPCLFSVRGWAQDNGYDYRFLGDELFSQVPEHLLEKTKTQIVIATDLARLGWMQRLLGSGYDQVAWFDADLLVLQPERLCLPDVDFAVGREIWVQAASGHSEGQRQKLRLYKKVHNAVLVARRGGASLPFYLQTALDLVDRHQGGMPPQFVGPKLLTALHNVVQFPVMETVNMLPPVVATDWLEGDGPALSRYAAACVVSPAALNLCSSSIERNELSPEQMDQLVVRLLRRGCLFD